MIGKCNTGGGKPEEEKTVTAGTSAIVVLPSSGKTMKKVTVNPTPTEEKTVTPTTSQQTVSPSNGKHLAKVIVEAMEDVTPEVTAQTPVITQIAENLGVTITTPTGTNKQILQGNNANLLNIKNNAPSVTIDGVRYKEDLSLKSFVVDTPLDDLPTSIQNRLAVKYNNEIHIFSGTKHYKFDGLAWTSVSTLPESAGEDDVAVVLNNEIHLILNGYQKSTHYKFNGSAWTSVSELPYEIEYGCGVALNGEIHLLGSHNDGVEKKHYKFNGSTWVSVSTLPYNFYYGDAIVIDNEIHIFGGTPTVNTGAKNHYKFNGSAWTSVSELPYGFKDGKVVFLDSEIHILGGYVAGFTSTKQNHYKYVAGTGWVSVSSLPYDLYKGSAVVLDNKIHLLGCYDETYYKKHYIIQGTAYFKIGKVV